jgi:hypothetical protein
VAVSGVLSPCAEGDEPMADILDLNKYRSAQRRLLRRWLTEAAARLERESAARGAITRSREPIRFLPTEPYDAPL